MAVVIAAGLLAPASAQAFDTGPHTDVTRDAMRAEGFGATATDVAVVGNWFVDLYSNASKIPQSGHAKTSIEIVGSLFGPRENWPPSVLTAVNGLHFDASLWDVSDAVKAEQEWTRLQRATSQVLRAIKSGGLNREMQVLITAGASLHALQDFYSHSTWIEPPGVDGNEGPDWNQLRYGSHPTWFDLPPSARQRLNVYIGESTGHEERPHGVWNSDANRSMVHGVNKDWPGRFGYTNASIAGYFASRQWLRGMRAALGDDALWRRAMAYADRRSGDLDHDLKGALRIGMMTGHWQGQGEPCDVSISLNVCGSRNGLGGDLIGARNVIRDYFEDRGRTLFRRTFEATAPMLAKPDPAGDALPMTSTLGMQASTQFVRVRVTSMKGVGLRSLGDPTLADRADMFSRAKIAGQEQQSGEINGRDSFGFGKPYAPFEFVKAITKGASYPQPVTTMTVEIRTSSSAWSGTDDDVYLRISPTRRFSLDKRLYNDFERGDRDTYSVPIDDATLSGLSVGDISRVQIEKAADGVGGGWKLRGVKLVVNGRVAYARDGIDRWLEDGHRVWRAPNFVPTAPTGRALPITLDLWDEDSFVYGGNDHGDINPYDRRKRLALAYTPGTPVDLPAAGGSKHSGRLGDGDQARITYTIDTITPVLPPPNAPVAEAPPVKVEPGPEPQPQPQPQPTAKPDLAITFLGYDETALWSFVVKNQGTAAAGSFSVDVSGEGPFLIPGLAAGESATRTFRTTCKVATWQATADAGAQVGESDETNNTRTYTQDICLA